MRHYKKIFVLLIIVLVATRIYFVLFSSVKRPSSFTEVIYTDSTIAKSFPKNNAADNQLPYIAVKNANGNQLHLQSIAVRVYTENGFARTCYDLLFKNELDRILEGELQLPLREGQMISNFELEVNGHMRAAVAVEKQQARVAYETTVRKGIDPGLIEKVQGNLFKMRVFPILARATKRVRLEIVEALPCVHHKFNYQLSLSTNYPLRQFDFKAYNYDGGKRVLLQKHQSKGRCLKQQISIYLAHSQKQFSRVELHAKEAFVNLNLPLAAQYIKRCPPKKVSLCWDCSGSRTAAQKQKELALLKDYFRWMRNGTVECVFFAHRLIQRQTFHITNGKTKLLLNVLSSRPYDGASNLNSIPFLELKGEEILLFTDGLNTLGKVPKTFGKKPITIIQSSLIADNGLLQHIATVTKGQFIALQQQSLHRAKALLKRSYLKFLGFKAQKGQAQLEYYTHEAQWTPGRLLMSVQVPVNLKVLTAQFGFDQKHIHKAIRYQLLSESANRLQERHQLEKWWAIAKLQTLEQQAEQNKAAILKLGLKYHLVSSQTSMLVLDEVEDYAQHGILPPHALRKAYYPLRKKFLLARRQEQAQHMSGIRKDWKAYLKWYQTKPGQFDVDKSNVEALIINGDAAQAVVSEPIVSVQTMENDAPHADADTTINVAAFSVQGATSASGTFSYSWNAGNDLSAFSSSRVSLYAPTYHVSMSRNGNATNDPEQTIQIAAWDPQVRYLKILRKVAVSRAYLNYLALKKTYGQQPSFYLDVSDYFQRKKQDEIAIRVLSNLAELELKDAALMRVLATKLLQLKQQDLALQLFADIIELRPEEPQSYRDYALALANIGRYNEAVKILYRLVKKPFDGRFDGIHLIALNEINQLIAAHPKLVDAKVIPAIFRKEMPMDIRIVLNWDADNTDIDLWVTEPNQEKCMYSYPLTSNGGRLSNDFTQGYGPEEYVIRRAPKGTYNIQAHFYGNRRPDLKGKTILSIELFQYYGTRYEVKKVLTRRLEAVDQEIDLATFEFK